ncbi:MAG: FtsQ-type POTRA domain-containing protein [Vicinamibacteria bacterium]|nr:FtsQ-type POTRA domain-containing protein [Vicinamibacteria bacterium]
MSNVMEPPEVDRTPSGDLPLNVGVEGPFLRPRSRMRLRPARRVRMSRVTLILRIATVAIIGVTAAGLIRAQVREGDRFKVSRLVTRGNRHLSNAEIRERLGSAMGENILRIRLEDLEARLRKSPWVDRATIRRTLPDTLDVDIVERVPLALAEMGTLCLMDAEGVLIDSYGPRVSGYDLPIVRGLAALDPETRSRHAMRAGALLDDLGDLAREVSEIVVEEAGDVRVILAQEGEVLLFNSPPYKTRLSTFLAMRGKLKERCPHAEFFDLRFSGRIIVRETRSAEARDASRLAQASEAAIEDGGEHGGG